jgi:hypothetical protein
MWPTKRIKGISIFYRDTETCRNVFINPDPSEKLHIGGNVTRRGFWASRPRTTTTLSHVVTSTLWNMRNVEAHLSDGKGKSRTLPIFGKSEIYHSAASWFFENDSLHIMRIKFI